MLRITTFPRVHITLIGMNNDGYRINGGIGLSFSEPKINGFFEVSKNIEIKDERNYKFTKIEETKLQRLLSDTYVALGMKKKIRCTIRSDVYPHYGLGSNTAIIMSCIEALFILNDIDYQPDDIIKHSKRGGTSGIGINTYLVGGFVFDVGIKKNKQLFNPSSIAKRNGKIPLVIHKCRLPNWEIGICIPKYILNKTELEEIDFFRTHCPIDRLSTENILYEAVFGITSSIIENDYDVFCKSVNNIQTTKWKYLERTIYGDDLIKLEGTIKALGADCVGMSSLGPMLFFTGKDIEKIIEGITSKNPNTFCYCTSFNNQGRIINYD